MVPHNAPLPDDELYELAAEVLHGTADGQQQARLESLLCQSLDARRAYLRYMLLHAELSLTDEALLAGESSAPSPAARSRESESANVEPISHLPTAGSASLGNEQASRRARWLLSLAGGLAVVVVLAVGLGHWWSESTERSAPSPSLQAQRPGVSPEGASTGRSENPGHSYYDHRKMPLTFVATLQDTRAASTPAHSSSQEGGPSQSGGQRLSATTMHVEKGETHLAFAGGADVRIQGPTLFGLESKDTGVLFSGALRARVRHPEARFSVQTPSVRIVDLGTEFRVRVNDRGQTEVRVLEGEVEIQTRVRLPRYYWNFDGPRSDLQDLVSGQRLRCGDGVRRVPGLIGGGALEFDNTPEAYLEVQGDGGKEVGTGGFAVTHGITIEALILPRWSGKWKDYDEIFRKEDGDYRILLSFQNDDYDYAVPRVEPGPCLSFGLHLAGLGYSELDMPLDGQDGRPTLAQLQDGRPHHIVATYDSFSGRKTLYIDGQRCFEHTFPQGTLILSGGPAPARIGNTQHPGQEPFQGVIDEVAFYDFALTCDEIAIHYARVCQGENYFGTPAPQLRTVRWKRMTVVTEGESKLFDHALVPPETPPDAQGT